MLYALDETTAALTQIDRSSDWSVITRVVMHISLESMESCRTCASLLRLHGLDHLQSGEFMLDRLPTDQKSVKTSTWPPRPMYQTIVDSLSSSPALSKVVPVVELVSICRPFAGSLYVISVCLPSAAGSRKDFLRAAFVIRVMPCSPERDRQGGVACWKIFRADDSTVRRSRSRTEAIGSAELHPSRPAESARSEYCTTCEAVSLSDGGCWFPANSISAPQLERGIGCLSRLYCSWSEWIERVDISDIRPTFYSANMQDIARGTTVHTCKAATES